MAHVLKNHNVKVFMQGKFLGRPWTSLCQSPGCGNEGQFATEQEAIDYAGLHVSRRGGKVILPEKPEPKEEVDGSGTQQENVQEENADGDEGREETKEVESHHRKAKAHAKGHGH